MDFTEFMKNFEQNSEFQQDVYRNFSKISQERTLKPYQAELIKLQEHLEKKELLDNPLMFKKHSSIFNVM